MKATTSNRRQFIKKVGAGSALIGSGLAVPQILGSTPMGPLVSSDKEFGQLPVVKMDNGQVPYQINDAVFKRMNQKNNIFSRNGWDPIRFAAPHENIQHKNLVEGKGVVPNQTRLDYALMSASWSIARMRNSPCYEWGDHDFVEGSNKQDSTEKWDPATLDMGPDETAKAVKHASLFLGASQVGIADLNPAWLYGEVYSPTTENRERSIPFHYGGDKYGKTEEAWYLPSAMNKVVVFVFEEDYEAMSNSPGRIASAATGDGYSRMAATAYKVAEFIRNLGYRALPAGNEVALSIPMAIDAGLGELGRNGLLVTPKYGPRVRIAKVITDLPMSIDRPIKFGVTEFCETCMLCAEDCPSKSISKGPQTWEGKDLSNNPGIFKWYVEPGSCFDYNGFSCSNCKMNCPFNKPNNEWTHKIVRGAIKLKLKPMNRVMTKMDQASEYGEQLGSDKYWQLDGSKKITAREKM